MRRDKTPHKTPLSAVGGLGAGESGLGASLREDGADLNPRRMGFPATMGVNSVAASESGQARPFRRLLGPPWLRQPEQQNRWLVVAALLALGTTAMAAWMAPHQEEHPQNPAWQQARSEMVEQQLARRGVANPRVLAAMGEVPRHRFVPDNLQGEAYQDHPLPIGYDQTISQPYIVALMAELLDPKGDERVLEIGTGSGYHAAVLSRVVEEVYSIEIVEELGRRASRVLADLGYDNIHSRIGDGYRGWQEAAPFDAIILTAAPTRVPEPLVAQLRVGGRLVLPLGETSQNLQVLTKTEAGFERQVIAPVRFVPMTGEVLEGAGG